MQLPAAERYRSAESRSIAPPHTAGGDSPRRDARGGYGNASRKSEAAPNAEVADHRRPGSVIVWNLVRRPVLHDGDKGTTNRTVRALSWRIGISFALILMVIAGIYTGWIKPHGIYH
jgi:hypothetical protein